MPATDPISDMHLAIEPLLRPYFVAGKWQIDAVPHPLSLGEFQRLLGVSPWIGIAWREFTPAANAGRLLKGTHSLMLTLAVKNASGRVARLFGDRLGPGLYPALATAAGALHGRTVQGLGTLQVTRAGQAYSDGFGDLTVAIGVVELTCHTVMTPMADQVEAAPDFARLVSSFDLQPPADGREPVTDTIDLPGASAP